MGTASNVGLMVPNPALQGPAPVPGATYVPMPAVRQQRSTAPAIPYQYSLNARQVQHVLTAVPQPNPNVVGSWPVAVNVDPNVPATSSQRY